MADYWKSQGRKFCDYCKCWIADNRPSIDFHEGGRKHKENVSKRLKDIYKRSTKEAKQNRKLENDMKGMEAAANAAYLKDIQSNLRDMTADRIIHEKWSKPESSTAIETNPNNVIAEPDAHPRFVGPSEPEVDPCDPCFEQKLAKAKRKQEKKKAKLKAKEDAKKEKEDKESQEQSVQPPEEKYWYEARGPKGYSYYWNIVTNQTTWEPPLEGFLSLEQQAQQAQEQVIQEQFMNQIESEQAAQKAEILEEQRANAIREKFKEIRKQLAESKKPKTEENDTIQEPPDEESEPIPYRRDYSVPEKPQPYGSWKVVKTVKQMDLQLPEVKIKPVIAPVTDVEEPIERHDFTEKTCEKLAYDSDDEKPSFSFKKRKVNNFNVRQRHIDD